MDSDITVNVPSVKIKVNTTGVVFHTKSPGVIVSQTGTRLSITGNLSQPTAMILWRELHKFLHRSHNTTLPTYDSSKSLPDRFATLFSNKMMKIRESFSSSESCNTVHLPFDPSKAIVFTQVTQDEISKIISK